MSVKISSLELEAVKRINAVQMEPTKDGLTIIGGKNNQGKTSVLDAIAWALGGNKMKPDAPKNTESVRDPYLKVKLSNGIVAERKGKNSELVVTDPEGKKSGQTLLNSFIEAFALDLPRFMAGNDRDKADALLDTLGIKDKLNAIDGQIDALYDKRRAIGQMERTKRGAADDMPYYDDAPNGPVSASELIQEQQEILARNGENHKLREQAENIKASLSIAEQEAQNLSARMADIAEQLERKNDEVARLREQAKVAAKTAEELHDESTAEIEAALAEIEATNEKVRTNEAKARAEAEADELKAQYEQLDLDIEGARAKRIALLDGAKLPLEGLSVDHGILTYQGHTWSDMSSSQQLKVATAIVRAIKPECGFVLVDKLEQMDLDTLAEFAQWAEAEGLQVIGTRVSSGDECSIVIHDGYGEFKAEDEPAPVEASVAASERYVI